VDYPEPLERLVQELQRLPTVGPKTAVRLAFHLLAAPVGEVEALASAMVDVKSKLGACDRCGNLSDRSLCSLCRDPRRDPSSLCIVATARDLMAVERTREYRGLYHVLGGLISPLDGIGPGELRIAALLERLDSEPVVEMVVATNPTVAGEATALYLHRLVRDRPVKVTRLALGLPVGADLEYADEVTLGRALSGRREM
jgi:recombination protein RecR